MGIKNCKMKSKLNKTIDFDIESESGKKYLKNCIIDNENIKEYSKNEIKNKTINGDSFSILKKIKDKFVDLMIVDPPYNLSKDYHGFKFGGKDDLSYEIYTKSWIEAILPILKENASIYFCCD